MDRTQPSLTAADVMTASPRTCSVFSSVLEAVMVFRDADCGAVPVVDCGQPIGILTDRDVALALAQYRDVADRPVGDIMTRGVFVIEPDTPLEAVQEEFSERGVHRLLVVDRSGQLLGIVARTDLVSLGDGVRLDRSAGELAQQR